MNYPDWQPATSRRETSANLSQHVGWRLYLRRHNTPQVANIAILAHLRTVVKRLFPFLQIYLSRKRTKLRIPHSAFIPHSFPPVAPLLRHCRRTFGVIIASGGYGTRTPVPVRRKEGRRKPLHLGRCGCTKNMYIELFLLDNFLMNLLTLRAAAAMLSRKMKGSRAALVSFAGAAAAAAAAAGGTMFITLPVKLASTLLMALAFPPHSFRELMHSAAALFLSAAVAGGAVLLAALAFGGTLRGGVIYGAIPLRAALLGAAAAAFMPHYIRKILSRRVRNEQIVHIEYEFAASNSNRCEKNKSSHESKSSGITILKRDKRIFSAECLGIIDTGNALSEPISGLPVIVLGAKRHSEFAQAANVPIPMRTAAGESLLFGLKPKKLLINGCPVEAILAVGAKLDAALVPAVLAIDAARPQRSANLP